MISLAGLHPWAAMIYTVQQLLLTLAELPALNSRPAVFARPFQQKS